MSENCGILRILRDIQKQRFIFVQQEIFLTSKW